MKYKNKKTGEIIEGSDLEELKPFFLDGEELYPGDHVYVTSNRTGSMSIVDVGDLNKNQYADYAWHVNKIKAVIYALRHTDCSEGTMLSIIKILEND